MPSVKKWQKKNDLILFRSFEKSKIIVDSEGYLWQSGGYKT